MPRYVANFFIHQNHGSYWAAVVDDHHKIGLSQEPRWPDDIGPGELRVEWSCARQVNFDLSNIDLVNKKSNIDLTLSNIDLTNKTHQYCLDPSDKTSLLHIAVLPQNEN